MNANTKAKAIAVVPCVLLIGYGCLIATYLKYFDWALNYRVPDLQPAPEDILGLGFWVPWIIIACLFSVSIVIARVVGKKNIAFVSTLVLLFSILSAIDFTIYRMLEKQVLGG
jgi:hypothetical protein